MIDEFSNIREDLSEYIDVRLEQIKLSLAEIISRLFSSVLNAIIVICLIILVFLFLSFAAAFFLGSLLDSNHLGFLCVAAIYLMLLITFILLRKYLIDRPVIRSVISMFFPKSEEDEKK